MKIGVLALQGGFIEHLHALEKAGAESFEIRKKADLAGKDIDGLILPGGESTVIGKLMREIGLFDPLKELIEGGLPVFGTCAGMILLARRLENDPASHFGVLDVTVRRNAFGRQLGSFHTIGEFQGTGKIPMTFIRAPYIAKAADSVRILSVVNERIVAAESGNVLVTAFHPELTDDLRVLEYFLNKIGKPRAERTA